MAQHDYDIANQSGANFRADLNNALDAIVSNNSGSSQPSTTFAYEWWVDTSANLLKLRNSANNAWITLPLSITASNETSGALTVNGNLTTTGTVDVNGQELILDADADTSITADTDDQIDIRVGAVDVLTLTNSHLVLKGTTPKITIGDGGAEDTALIFDGNAQDFYIGLDDSEDDLVIGKGSTVGTTPAIIIDENLRVGIRDTSPSFVVDILGDNGDQLNLNNDGDRFTQLTLQNNGTTKANFNFDNTDSLAEIFAVSGAGLKLSTNGSESMRIASDGKVLINTTSTVGTSTALVEFNNLGSGGRILNTKDNGTGSCNAITFNNNNGQVGRITTSGSSTSYVQSSDYRMKENLVYDWEALPKIKDLKPAQFNFKTNTDEIVEGFIAHEAQSVVPYAVVGKKDGEEMQGMDYGKLTAILTKAIQELEERVKTLEG
ncbi:MAG: hypothetical protein CML17_00220 [Pusillimonas sp.]|nr:hypothetical protein [Pusillimonas sp.]